MQPIPIAPRKWPEESFSILVLLLFPLLSLCISTNWIYSETGGLDAWYYVGYSRNYRLYTEYLFPETYFGTRLGFILPGAVCYGLFKPAVANAVLHLFFYYLATFSLYSLLRSLGGRRSALMAALIMGGFPFFQFSVGKDNPDGAGLAYLTFCMAMTVKAATAEKPRIWLILAGIGSGAMVHSHLFLINYLLAGPFLYVGLKPAPSRIGSVKRIFEYALWAGLGCVLLTALFGTVNAVCGGSFFFFMPSFKYAKGFVSRPNPWKAETYAWVKNASWLLVDYLALVVALMTLYSIQKKREDRSRDRVRMVFSVHFVLLAVLMVAWEIKGTPVLQYYYYASYLIPGAFVLLGIALAEILDAGACSTATWMLMTGSLVALLLLQQTEWVIAALEPLTMGTYSLMGAILFAIGLLVSSMYVRRARMASATAFLAGILVLFAPCRHRSAKDNSEGFSRIIGTCEKMESLLDGRTPRFWYDKNESMAPEFSSLSSVYLWGFSLVNEEFPSIQSPVHGAALPRVEGAVLVVTSEREDADTTTLKALEDMGLTGRVLFKEPSGAPYTVTILEVLNGEPLGIEYDRQEMQFVCGTQVKSRSGPPELLTHWQSIAESIDVRIDRENGPATLSTREKEGACVCRLGPFKAEEDIALSFALWYKEGSGRIGFGALDSSGSAWQKKAAFEIKRQDLKCQRVEFTAKKGVPFWLGISNERKPNKGMTRIEVRRIEGFFRAGKAGAPLPK